MRPSSFFLKCNYHITGQELDNARSADGGSSGIGFLGQYEKLLEVIAEDTEMVGLMGLTHTQIAEALKKILYQGLIMIDGVFYKGIKATFDDRREEIQLKLKQSTVTAVSSPFYTTDQRFPDESSANRIYSLENVNRMVLLEAVSCMHPVMIGRYGFYESGRYNEYRTPPETLARIFGLTDIPEEGLIEMRRGIRQKYPSRIREGKKEKYI